MTRVVGLTGGVGTGKSSVARLLAELGAVVIDADAIVHELQAPGSPLLVEMVEAFGPGILDAEGNLDRARLGELVFRDEGLRARLNALVHPRVALEMARRLEEARSAGMPLVVLDIPLLFETRGAGGGLEAVVVVYAPEETQIQRLMARDGFDRAEAERRVRAQLPIEEKRRRADHVIDNSGSRANTERQVRALWGTLSTG